MLPVDVTCTRWSTTLLAIFQGFDGYLSSKDNLRKKARSFKMDDRMFSLSSSTSPVVGAQAHAAGLHCIKQHASTMEATCKHSMQAHGMMPLRVTFC
jgi:hypothetical protein